jgi:hypothetical protein
MEDPELVPFTVDSESLVVPPSVVSSVAVIDVVVDCVDSGDVLLYAVVLVGCSSEFDTFVVPVVTRSVALDVAGSLDPFIVVVVVFADVSVSVVEVTLSSVVDSGSSLTVSISTVVELTEDSLVVVLEGDSVEESVFIIVSLDDDVVLSDDEDMALSDEEDVIFSDDTEMVVSEDCEMVVSEDCEMVVSWSVDVSLDTVVDIKSVELDDESVVDSDDGVDVVSTIVKHAIIRKTAIHNMLLIC